MNFNPLKIFDRYDLSEASPEFTQKNLKDYNRHRPNGPQDLICQAPFKSIYFGHRGKAVACCWNRTYILGRYPERSIKEIWSGEEAENLRKYIRQNDLERGCQKCKAHILAGSYDVAKSKQYDELQLNDNGYPSVMEFELSNTCNLECGMCNGDYSSLIRKNRECRPPLQEPYDSEFVRQLEEFIPHLQEVKFYGGEPFLIEIYYKIWEKIIKINPSIRISVQTNGTILNNRVKRILEQSEFHINVSIDSLEKDNYERIRKNATFERTMEHIHWFREYCRERDTFFGISACAMQQNIHELGQFVRFCNDLDVPVYFHTVYYPKHHGFQSLPVAELQDMVEMLSAEQLPETTAIETKNKYHYEDQIRQLKHLIVERDVTHPEAGDISNMDDLRQYVREFIAGQTSWNEASKKKKQERILTNLFALETELGADFDYTQAFAAIDFENQVFMHQLLGEFEYTPTSELAAQVIGAVSMRANLD